MYIISIFKHRNLALGCIGYLITLYMCYYISSILMIVLASICTIAVFTLWLVYYFKRDKKLLSASIKYTPLLLFIILAIFVSSLSFVQDKKNLRFCDNEAHTVSGRVDSVIYTSDYFSTYTVTIYEIDGEQRKTRIVLTEEGNTIFENSSFTANVTLTPLTNNEIGFDTANYYLDKGILLSGAVIEFTSVQEAPADFKGRLKSINLFLDEIFKKQLNSDTYPIVSALFLGNRHLLSDRINRDFSRVGIVHILSLGGMHISIIITMLGFAISKIKIHRLLQTTIMIVSIILFVGITGFSETAMRAGVMQMIFYLLFLLWNKADSITSLFASITLICIFAPYLIFSLSLMLSFFAMLGCICSARLLYKSKLLLKVRIKLFRFIILTTVTTLGVTFMVLPYSFLYFGSVSLLAIPANIVIVPLLNILIYLSPFILVFSPMPYICDFLTYICEVICELTTTVCHFLSNLRGICINITDTAQLIGVISIFVSCMLILILSKKHLKLSLFSLFVSIIVLSLGTGIVYIKRNDNYYITSSSFGEQDTVCVEENNKLTIIDISGFSLNIATPEDYCSYLGYTEIENYVALSYSHKLPKYIDYTTDNVVVRSVYLAVPFTENEQKYYDECVAILKSKNISYYYANKLSLEEINFKLCEESFVERSTKRAVVFSLLASNNRYTYFGASSYELGTYLPSQLAAASDILVFGAYGPKYQITYHYDTQNCKYLIYLGDSKRYAGNIAQNAVVAEKLPVTIKIKK